MINGTVIGRNTGRGNALYDVSAFVEREFRITERFRVSVRGEGFNLFNHANTIGRVGVISNPFTFATTLGGVANVDPGRMFQFQARAQF